MLKNIWPHLPAISALGRMRRAIRKSKRTPHKQRLLTSPRSLHLREQHLERQEKLRSCCLPSRCCWQAARLRCAGNPRSTVSIRTRTASFAWSSCNQTEDPDRRRFYQRSRHAAQPHRPAEPDGTLDAAFDPNANDVCRFDRGAGDGKILVRRHLFPRWRRTAVQPSRATASLARLEAAGTEQLTRALIPTQRVLASLVSVQSWCRRTARFSLAVLFQYPLTPNGAHAVTRNNIARLLRRQMERLTPRLARTQTVLSLQSWCSRMERSSLGALSFHCRRTLSTPPCAARGGKRSS